MYQLKFGTKLNINLSNSNTRSFSHHLNIINKIRLLISSTLKTHKVSMKGKIKESTVGASFNWARLGQPVYLNRDILSTLREESFVGINFREFFFRTFRGKYFRELGFTEDFAGINFRELSLTRDFAGINFRESALFKDFAGVNSTFASRNIYSTTLVCGFENNFSKN